MDCASVDHPSDVRQYSVSQPRPEDKFYVEEIKKELRLANSAGARQLFERWMAKGPDHYAWIAYIHFELYRKELSGHVGWERVRSIFERYVRCHTSAEAWVRYSDFEMKFASNVPGARRCYERAEEQLGGDNLIAEFYIAFGQFEENCQEFERAKRMYEYVFDYFSGTRAAEDLYQRILKVEEAPTKDNLE